MMNDSASLYGAATHVGCRHAVDEGIRLLDCAHGDLVAFEVAAALHAVQGSNLREGGGRTNDQAGCQNERCAN